MGFWTQGVSIPQVVAVGVGAAAASMLLRPGVRADLLRALQAEAGFASDPRRMPPERSPQAPLAASDLIPAGLAAGVLSAVAFARWGWSPALWISVCLAVAGPWAVITDLRHHLLPKWGVRAWGITAAVGGLLLAAAGEARWERVLSGCACAAASWACLVLLRRWRPGWIGGGDVRLMLPLGWSTGWFFPPVTLAALVLADLSALVVLAAGVGAQRWGWRHRLAFGPWLVAGAAIAILVLG